MPAVAGEHTVTADACGGGGACGGEMPLAAREPAVTAGACGGEGACGDSGCLRRRQILTNRKSAALFLRLVAASVSQH